MSAIKKNLARKAAKTTAKHSARGAASKFRRNPVRAMTLLGLGGAIGAVAGWIAGRSAAGAPAARIG
jgi:hypothetical protein